MKLTARNDQATIKSQSKSDFARGKYGYWRKSASWETSKVRALIGGEMCCCYRFGFLDSIAIQKSNVEIDIIFSCFSKNIRLLFIAILSTAGPNYVHFLMRYIFFYQSLCHPDRMTCKSFCSLRKPYFVNFIDRHELK